ncbi:MAG: DsbA family protein [Myxococcales bacterium]|nr:DsbA family protein [Myxococcales bacterium]
MTLFLAALLALTPVTAEQAKKAFPAVDLSVLTDQQRGVFIDVAAEVYNYAGCQDTLAICLNPAAKDAHALRMAGLVKALVREGAPEQAVVQAVERYYDGFAPKQRASFRTDNCPVEGTGPIAIVEFSDYQCPHCAAALAPLTAVVDLDRAGQVRLCSKYFPFPSHPRARIAALCAEYARSKGKFWEMNTKLFQNQESLEDSDLKKYAKELGLDGDEMMKEVYAGKFDAAIEKHLREGVAAGVESTPSLFIDGRPYSLPVRPAYLQFAIDDEIQWKKEKGWKFKPVPAARKVAKGK